VVRGPRLAPRPARLPRAAASFFAVRPNISPIGALVDLGGLRSAPSGPSRRPQQRGRLRQPLAPPLARARPRRRRRGWGRRSRRRRAWASGDGHRGAVSPFSFRPSPARRQRFASLPRARFKAKCVRFAQVRAVGGRELGPRQRAVVRPQRTPRGGDHPGSVLRGV
jgi:hypothetical protein